jgi:hypothetical protein
MELMKEVGQLSLIHWQLLISSIAFAAERIVVVVSRALQPGTAIAITAQPSFAPGISAAAVVALTPSSADIG